MTARFVEGQESLRSLPPRRVEKVEKKGLAISLELGQPWRVTGPKAESVRMSIAAARDAFVEAQRLFLANPRHKAQDALVSASVASDDPMAE